MDKKNIKKHLTSTFLSEDKKPIGLSSTEKIQADSKKSNNANQKEVAKEMEGYEKSLEKETEPVKYENGEKEEEFQDLATYNQGSIINLKPDNDPGEAWVEKNKQAITGKKSTQGNSTEYANVIPEDQAGFTGPDFNDNLYKNNVKFNDKVEKSRKAQDARIGVNVNSDTNDNYLKENKKSKMKRLVFKKEFKGVGNALNLIPETYKVNGKQFHMTDGNEKYEIRWEGSLTEGRAIVLKASDKNLMNEDMENMKRLMGYKSQDTLGAVKGSARLDENARFNDILGKTKNLMTEMTGGYGFTGEGNLEGTDESIVYSTGDKKGSEEAMSRRAVTPKYHGIVINDQGEPGGHVEVMYAPYTHNDVKYIDYDEFIEKYPGALEYYQANGNKTPEGRDIMDAFDEESLGLSGVHDMSEDWG
jgi:hypothetical protein